MDTVSEYDGRSDVIRLDQTEPEQKLHANRYQSITTLLIKSSKILSYKAWIIDHFGIVEFHSLCYRYSIASSRRRKVGIP